MRNSQTGVFELYDISNNAITATAPMGQVGLEWSISGESVGSGSAPLGAQLSGIAADPAGATPSGITAQFTQAMASFAPSGATPGTSPIEQTVPPAAIDTNPDAQPRITDPRGLPSRDWRKVPCAVFILHRMHCPPKCR